MIARDDRAGLEEALRRGLEGVPGVAAAFLFGSHATGRARPESDVDVAILLAQPPADRLRALRAIVEALGEHVSAETLDVVLLHDAPVALAFQVLKHGRLLACRDEVALHRFEVRTYREHGDREPVERFFREAVRARAAKQAGRG